MFHHLDRVRRSTAFISLISIVILSLGFQCLVDQYSDIFFAFLHLRNEVNSSRCLPGTFRLGGMSDCHLLLQCAEIARDLEITNHQLGHGAQKIVMRGVWHHHDVAVSLLRHREYLDDFQHGLNMLLLFGEDPGHVENKVVQIVGWCLNNSPMIITEMHHLGGANNIHALLTDNFTELDSLLFRFSKCVEFVRILNILHTHPKGPRVLCDANYPEKALSQFLLSDNLSLILNDMDALPRVDRRSGQLIKCGHRELEGEFVAPEQRWGLDEEEYDDEKMPHYDEKVDIWKIPDICNFLIGDIAGASKLQLHLFNIHSKCKQTDPQERPCAKDVLFIYEQVFEKLQ